MTLSPHELATCKDTELLDQLAVLVWDADWDLRSFQKRLVERGIQRTPSEEALNRADGFLAIRRLLERMKKVGRDDQTIRKDLIPTVRKALEEAGNMRGCNGPGAEAATTDVPGSGDADSGAL